MTNLIEIIKFVKPTALLGLSTITVRASGHPASDQFTDVVLGLAGGIHAGSHSNYGISQSPSHHLSSIQPCSTLGMLVYRCCAAYKRISTFCVWFTLPGPAIPGNYTLPWAGQ